MRTLSFFLTLGLLLVIPLCSAASAPPSPTRGIKNIPKGNPLPSLPTKDTKHDHASAKPQQPTTKVATTVPADDGLPKKPLPPTKGVKPVPTAHPGVPLPKKGVRKAQVPSLAKGAKPSAPKKHGAAAAPKLQVPSLGKGNNNATASAPKPTSPTKLQVPSLAKPVPKPKGLRKHALRRQNNTSAATTTPKPTPTKGVQNQNQTPGKPVPKGGVKQNNATTKPLPSRKGLKKHVPRVRVPSLPKGQGGAAAVPFVATKGVNNTTASSPKPSPRKGGRKHIPGRKGLEQNRAAAPKPSVVKHI